MNGGSRRGFFRSLFGGAAVAAAAKTAKAKAPAAALIPVSAEVPPPVKFQKPWAKFVLPVYLTEHVLFRSGIPTDCRMFAPPLPAALAVDGIRVNYQESSLCADLSQILNTATIKVARNGKTYRQSPLYSVLPFGLFDLNTTPDLLAEMEVRVVAPPLPLARTVRFDFALKLLLP